MRWWYIIFFDFYLFFPESPQNLQFFHISHFFVVGLGSLYRKWKICFCFKLIFIYFFLNHHKIYNFLTSKTLLCVGFFSGKVKMWKIVNLNTLKPPNYQNLINTCLLDLIKQDNTRFCWKNSFIFLIFHWKKIKKCSKIFIKFWCILIPKIIIS